ncbi:MAG: hypothetical protein KDK91_21780, partial [Gammaproteobacteria bacterium]|nr:hypothetical protein [Gammaproteobacteria bacterium]
MNQPVPARGRFITLEGVEGAGKTTQVELLQSWLVEALTSLASPDPAPGVVRTREPGGTPVA